MTRRFQFSLRALMVAVASMAVGFGMISWLPPKTQRDLATFVLMLLYCYSILALIFCVGVLVLATAMRATALAVSVVVFCYNRCHRTISSEE
jgi:hypothetical protein